MELILLVGFFFVWIIGLLLFGKYAYPKYPKGRSVMTDKIKEDIRGILNEYHDNIVNIFTHGEQHNKDYSERIDKLDNQAISDIEKIVDKQDNEVGAIEVSEQFKEIMRWDWFSNGFIIDLWGGLAKRLANALLEKYRILKKAGE